MGLRFRKSVKMGPLRINFSKSGVGYSVGTKGYRVTKRADGKTQTTASIPGTGIAYTNVSGSATKGNPSGGSTPPRKPSGGSPEKFELKFGHVLLIAFVLFMMASCVANTSDQKKQAAEQAAAEQAAAAETTKQETPKQEEPQAAPSEAVEEPAEDQPQDTAQEAVQAPQEAAEPPKEETPAEPSKTPSETPAAAVVPVPAPKPQPEPKPEPEPEPEPAPAPAQKNEKTVYVTKTGKRYHYDSSCNGGTYYPSTLTEAQNRGLTPCQKCVG